MPNKKVKLIRSRSFGQPKAVLRTFLAATYLSRYVSKELLSRCTQLYLKPKLIS